MPSCNGFFVFYFVPRWHEAEKDVVWVKLTHSKREKQMGQNDPATTWTFCPRGAPPYIVHMHTACDHAVNLHGRRLNIVCGTVEGKNEGSVDSPPYGIGLCPIL